MAAAGNPNRLEVSTVPLLDGVLMKLNADADISALLKRMPREGVRLAKSVARAINRTLLDVQVAERVQLDQAFTIRKAQFMYRLIKITAFASANQGRPFGEIAIDASKARVLLPVFEAGGAKDPAKGKNVAVPLTGEAARPSFGALVPDAFTFQQLRFKRVNLTKAGQAAQIAKKSHGVKGKLTGDYYIWAGQQRTFILPSTKAAPHGGVFERVGPGRDDIRLIYSFRPQVKLAKKISFVERAEKVYGAKFAGYLLEEWQRG
jgi:hypothetical protein